MRKLAVVAAGLALLWPLLAAAGILLLANPAVTAQAAGRICLTAPGTSPAVPAPPETTQVVVPVPEGRYTITSQQGWRTDPFTGEQRYHDGADFAAADGTPILAAADGVVLHAGPSGGYGNLIVLLHTVGGEVVTTGYAHMWDDGVYVQEGQQVTAGQVIGAVGSSGRSTGAHLHFELRRGGWDQPPDDPLAWLADNHAIGLGDDDSGPATACPSPTPTTAAAPAPSDETIREDLSPEAPLPALP